MSKGCVVGYKCSSAVRSFWQDSELMKSKNKQLKSLWNGLKDADYTRYPQDLWKLWRTSEPADEIRYEICYSGAKTNYHRTQNQDLYSHNRSWNSPALQSSPPGQGEAPSPAGQGTAPHAAHPASSQEQSYWPDTGCTFLLFLGSFSFKGLFAKIPFLVIICPYTEPQQAPIGTSALTKII